MTKSTFSDYKLNSQIQTENRGLKRIFENLWRITSHTYKEENGRKEKGSCKAVDCGICNNQPIKECVKEHSPP